LQESEFFGIINDKKQVNIEWCEADDEEYGDNAHGLDNVGLNLI